MSQRDERAASAAPRKTKMNLIPQKLPKLLHHPLLIVCFVTGSSLLPAQNLVTNGGFERGLTSGGWSHNRSGIAQATFSLETGLPYSGTNALKVVTAQLGHDSILWKSTTLAEGSWQEVTDAVHTGQNR